MHINLIALQTQFLNFVLLGNTVKSYLLFSGIILLFAFLKRVFSKLCSHFLLKLFGRFGKEVEANIFAEMLVKPIEFFLGVLLIYLAINQLNYPLDEPIFARKLLLNGKEVMSTITVIQAVDKISLFLTIVAVFWILLRIIDFVAYVFTQRASLTATRRDDQVIPFVKELAKISTLTAGFFVILGAVFDINVVTLIAGLGIGGIAIALAAKESLENLLGSFTIFVDKPFEVGDYVKVMGMEGTVERVGFRSTRIRTPDKTLVTMPNKKMIDTPLENLSARGYRRVKFNVAFGYQTPLEAVNLIAKQLTEYINNHEYINADTLVSIDLISTNGIELQVIYFVEMIDQALHVQVKQDVNQQLLLLAKQHGASFTQLVLPNPVSA